MTNKQSKEYSVNEWLLRAQDDELSSKAILNCKQGAPGTVCFLSQQMAEKCLKAYFIYKKSEFPKIHQLDRLVKLCKEIDVDFGSIKDESEYLTAFYVTARYPGNYPEFNFKEAENAFKKAMKIKDFVLSKIHG